VKQNGGKERERERERKGEKGDVSFLKNV